MLTKKGGPNYLYICLFIVCIYAVFFYTGRMTLLPIIPHLLTKDSTSRSYILGKSKISNDTHA